VLLVLPTSRRLPGTFSVDTASANRRDDAELGEVGADNIDYGSLLTSKEVARAMEHEAALLRGHLGLHEAHALFHNGFSNSLSIGGVLF
jgi:hypothetical protein